MKAELQEQAHAHQDEVRLLHEGFQAKIAALRAVHAQQMQEEVCLAVLLCHHSSCKEVSQAQLQHVDGKRPLYALRLWNPAYTIPESEFGHKQTDIRIMHRFYNYRSAVISAEITRVRGHDT